MSDNDNKQQIIDEYETKREYLNNLSDDITNLEMAINEVKANIKNTQQMQDRIKQQNYNIWSTLEVKEIKPKTAEKQPSINDILGSFK